MSINVMIIKIIILVILILIVLGYWTICSLRKIWPSGPGSTDTVPDEDDDPVLADPDEPDYQMPDVVEPDWTTPGDYEDPIVPDVPVVPNPVDPIPVNPNPTIPIDPSPTNPTNPTNPTSPTKPIEDPYDPPYEPPYEPPIEIIKQPTCPAGYTYDSLSGMCVRTVRTPAQRNKIPVTVTQLSRQTAPVTRTARQRQPGVVVGSKAVAPGQLTRQEYAALLGIMEEVVDPTIGYDLGSMGSVGSSQSSMMDYQPSLMLEDAQEPYEVDSLTNGAGVSLMRETKQSAYASKPGMKYSTMGGYLETVRTGITSGLPVIVDPIYGKIPPRPVGPAPVTPSRVPIETREPTRSVAPMPMIKRTDAKNMVVSATKLGNILLRKKPATRLGSYVAGSQKRGSMLRRATKTAKTGCRDGYQLDPNGTCWKCPDGFNRTWSHVDASDACARGDIFSPETRYAIRELQRTCNKSGEFFDMIDGGTCWTCPPGTSRTLSSVTADDACAGSCDQMYGANDTQGVAFQHLLTGECHSCPPGYVRNLNPLGDSACSRAVGCKNTYGDAAFTDLLTESCWTCGTDGYIRTPIVPVTDDGACSKPEICQGTPDGLLCYECPSGYVYNGNGTCKLVATSTATCPVGTVELESFKNFGTSILEGFEVGDDIRAGCYECPSGTVLQGGVCVLPCSAPGVRDAEGRCVRCPDSYELVTGADGRQMCRSLSCPAGTTRVGDECLSCPVDSALDPLTNMCVSTAELPNYDFVLPPNSRVLGDDYSYCPEGYTRKTNRLCEHACGAGEVIHKGKCGKCPPGFTYNSRIDAVPGKECYKTTDCLTDANRHRAVRDSDGVCWECPEGYEMDSKTLRCYPVGATCPEGHVWDGSSNCRSCNAAEGWKLNPAKLTECVRDLYCPAVAGAPDGVMLDGKCVSCPAGHMWNATLKKCVTQRACELKPDGKCYECPRGWQRDHSVVDPADSKACYRVLECPEGYRLDAQTKRCVLTVTDGANPPTIDGGKAYQCPPGYRLDSGSRDRCVKDVTESVCPAGREMSSDGLCHLTSCPHIAGGDCMECGAGYAWDANEQNCVANECPAGHTLNGGMCTICSPGWNLMGDGATCEGPYPATCANGKNTDSSGKCYSCPDGYDEVGGVCVARVANVCGNGSVLDGADCLTTDTLAPVYA